MIEIETERLTLKRLGIADKERLIALIGDLRVSETLSKVPTILSTVSSLVRENVSNYKDLQSFKRLKWCPGSDSNRHGITTTGT